MCQAKPGHLKPKIPSTALPQGAGADPYLCSEGKQAWMSVPSFWRLYLLGPGRFLLQSSFWGEGRRCSPRLGRYAIENVEQMPGPPHRREIQSRACGKVGCGAAATFNLSQPVPSHHPVTTSLSMRRRAPPALGMWSSLGELMWMCRWALSGLRLLSDVDVTPHSRSRTDLGDPGAPFSASCLPLKKPAQWTMSEGSVWSLASGFTSQPLGRVQSFLKAAVVLALGRWAGGSGIQGHTQLCSKFKTSARKWGAGERTRLVKCLQV